MNVRERKLRHVALAILFAAVITGLSGLPMFDAAYDLDVDLHHGLQHILKSHSKAGVSSPTVVVALDETTYTTKPFLGLPRVMWTPQIAAVQDAILDAGANVIGWDFILPTSASAFVSDKSYDRALLKSLSRARQARRIVLGMSQIGQQTIQPHRLFLLTAGGALNLRSLGVNSSADGVVRSVPTFVNTTRSDGQHEYVPSMSLELASRLLGRPPVRLSGGRLKIGSREIRGVDRDRIALNFASGTEPIPTYSLADLWKCADDLRADFFRKNFSGKAVLFGLLLDIEDRKLASNRFFRGGIALGSYVKCNDDQMHPSSFTHRRATTPGVYLIATATNNLVAGDALQRFSRTNRILLALPLAILAATATLFLGILWTGAVSILGALVWLGLGIHGFGSAHVLPLSLPLATCALTWVGVLGLRFAALDREGRFLRRAFGSYVAPALVESLVKDPDRLKLGGERREMSFLFTDLADFASLVEQQDPELTVALMNQYLNQMIDIVKDHGGTIDKVIGDALVVLFSAPITQENHAERAIECALDIDAAATAFSQEQRAQGIAFGVTRIGVHSGHAVVGNFGGSGFFDYTAIGDAMNIAARLENANKHLGTRIAVSRDTIKQVPNFQGRPVGSIILKGMKNAVEVYEPWNSTESTSDFRARYEHAYDLLHSAPERAAKAFNELSEAFPDDRVVALHRNRLKAGESGIVVVLDEK